MDDLKSKFNKLFHPENNKTNKANNKTNDHVKEKTISSHLLQKLSLKPSDKYANLSDHELSIAFIRKVDKYLKYQLESEGYWNNPDPPQKFLTSIAKQSGIAEYQVFVGYIPPNKEELLRKTMIHHLSDLFKLKNFNGFELIFRYTKRLKNMNMIILSWANQKLPSYFRSHHHINRNDKNDDKNKNDRDARNNRKNDEECSDGSESYSGSDDSDDVKTGLIRNLWYDDNEERKIRVQSKLLALIKLSELMEDNSSLDPTYEKPKINISEWIRQGDRRDDRQGSTTNDGRVDDDDVGTEGDLVGFVGENM